MTATKPVILAAFANEPVDSHNYLRKLSVEQRRVRAALETAKSQNLCDFELLHDATLDDIIAAFRNPDLRGRIAVFHYGGHADSFELLFQSESGNLERINGRGFAAFLAEQPSLQLVFLNACSTEPQVDGLLAANVHVVLATSQEVDDEVASLLAAQFYEELAHGASIGSAYRQAVAVLRARRGDDPTQFYARGARPNVDDAAEVHPDDSGLAGSSAPAGYWPWMLRTRAGAEAAVEWSLPLAAGDPLFGLPPLPTRPLPDSPYQRALDYYTRDIAELFFGRGREIRSLYQRVTAAGHSSVILYYGQSGVGKSSLLDAGLAPRLEATHVVVYARRDRSLGLLGTLRKQLTATGSHTALTDLWLATEQQVRRPVVLILDQVEEVFTRRNPEQPHELQEFVSALQDIGADEHKPQGALLLGFRKEHLAEIVSALREQHIAFVGQFLAPLDGYAIQEVVLGPLRSARLRDKYGIMLDAELPEIIARDLAADPESPVAPTLNILLRKLWAAATGKSASAPHFSVQLYGQLRREGILLEDFLRQQNAKVAEELPADVASGLLLDLWAFHTTAIGTSDQRDVEELRQVYGHQPNLAALVLRSKELYVLTDPPGDNPNAGTQLAHDALAPLVRRDYDQSTLPGQQARRLLESRAIDWGDGRTGALFDDAALAVVDRGLAGTRSLSRDETRLLMDSRKAQGVRRRQKRLVQFAAAALVMLMLLISALIFWNNQQLILAEKERALAMAQIEAERADRINAERLAAEERNRSAELNVQLTSQNERAALRMAQVSESQRIAQLSQQQLTVDPVVSIHLALAALPRTPDQPLVPEAEYALRQAVLTSRERKLVMTTVDSLDQFAIRGNRVAVGGSSPIVYDTELNPQEFPLPPDFTDVRGLRWGNDGRLLGWNPRGVWVTGGLESRQFSLDAQGPGASNDEIRCAEWQPAQRWVAICTFDALYAWQPESGRVITLTTEIDTPDLPTEPRSAIWSADGHWLTGLGAKLVIWDSTAPQAPAQVFYPPQEPGQPVSFAYWLPDHSLVAGWFPPGAADLELQRWRPNTEELEPVALPTNLTSHIQVQTLYAPDAQNGTPRLLLWSSDGLLALYNLDGQKLAEAAGVIPNLNGVTLSPNGERAAGYAANGALTIWTLDDLDVWFDLAGGIVTSSLIQAEWLDDNTLALGDENGVVQIARKDELTSNLSITRLFGYGARERLARAWRLANGRLLAVGLADRGESSLRIWQIVPVATLAGEGLPAVDDPLCRRLQRVVALPAGVGRPYVQAWQHGDELLTTDGDGQVAHWTIGGEAQVLPADEDRRNIVVAPDAKHVLRYGDGTNGQIWRLDASGWVQDGTLPGEFSGAVWTDHGILATFVDSSAAVIDPASGRRQAAPADMILSGSALLTDSLLLAMRGAAVELWQLGDEQPLAAWSIPDDRRLRLDDAAKGGELFVYRDPIFGQLYVLRLDAIARTLTEKWRFEQAHVDSAPAQLNPAMPLLAMPKDGVVSLVDLDEGRVLWKSTSVAAVVGQVFRTVSWSADGKYMITQAQPQQQGSFFLNIGIWRWNDAERRPILLQEMPSSGLLGVSPEMHTVLAGEPGQPFADQPYVYPILADAIKLQTDVQVSCLLDRPLSDEQREAYMIPQS